MENGAELFSTFMRPDMRSTKTYVRRFTLFLQELKFSNEVVQKYLDAQSRARFHFGAEVEQYLEQLRSDMILGEMFDRYGPPDARPVLPRNVYPSFPMDEQTARLNRINAFYREIDRMFVPYMRLDQRMPLWWWHPLCERWRPFAANLKSRASGVVTNIAKLPKLLRTKIDAPRTHDDG